MPLNRHPDMMALERTKVVAAQDFNQSTVQVILQMRGR